nr:PREDICTED: uncharacterized protein LOC106701302 [Bos mutus]
MTIDPGAVGSSGGLRPPLALWQAGGTHPVHSRDPVAGTWNLLARGSGGTDGPRFPVTRLRRIVRVAKGRRVLLRPQTATRIGQGDLKIRMEGLPWWPMIKTSHCRGHRFDPWQEYWSGLPFPSPRDLPDPGIEPRSPAL